MQSEGIVCGRERADLPGTKPDARPAGNRLLLEEWPISIPVSGLAEVGRYVGLPVAQLPQRRKRKAPAAGNRAVAAGATWGGEACELAAKEHRLNPSRILKTSLCYTTNQAAAPLVCGCGRMSTPSRFR